MDEIVGDGIHEESDEKGRYAPMYDQKGNARYKAEDPPHETLLLRARGSAVAYDAKGLMHNSGIKVIKPPPQTFVKKGREDNEGAGEDEVGDDDDDDDDDADGGESLQDSFADVPGVLETESIADASLEPMAAALDDDDHSYYVPANEGARAEDLLVKRGVLTKSAAAKQLTSGSKSQWALSSDIEEQRDEEGHVYYTDPQNGATAWDWQELSNARAQRGEIADSSIEVDTTSHVSHEYGNKELTLRNGGGTGSSSSSLTAARVHEHGSIVTVGSGKSGGNDRGGGGGRVSSSGALAMPSSWNEEQYQQEQQHHQQQQYSYPSHTPPPHASSAHNNNAQHHPPQHEEYSGDVPEMQRSFVVKPGARGHASAITCATCCVTQDRELRVLTGSFDKTLRLWDGDGSSLARFQGHAGLVTAVAITKVNGVSGALRIGSISGSYSDRRVRLYTGLGGGGSSKKSSVEKEGGEAFGKPDFLPPKEKVAKSESGAPPVVDTVDDPYAAGGGEDGHTGAVTCVCIRELEDRSVVVVTGSTDKTIRVWNASPPPASLWSVLEGHTMAIRAMDTLITQSFPTGVDLSSNDHDQSGTGGSAAEEGKFLVASAGNDNMIIVWDGDQCVAQRSFWGHSSSVVAVKLFETGWSPGGVCVVSSSYDRTLRIWDASTWGDGTCLWSVDTGEKIPSPHALGIALLPQVRGFSKKKKDKKNKHGRDGYDDEAKALRLRIVVGLRGNAVHAYDVDASEYRGFSQYYHGASQTCPHHELSLEEGVSAVTLSPSGSRAWVGLKSGAFIGLVIDRVRFKPHVHLNLPPTSTSSQHPFVQYAAHAAAASPFHRPSSSKKGKEGADKGDEGEEAAAPPPAAPKMKIGRPGQSRFWRRREQQGQTATQHADAGSGGEGGGGGQLTQAPNQHSSHDRQSHHHHHHHQSHHQGSGHGHDHHTSGRSRDGRRGGRREGSRDEGRHHHHHVHRGEGGREPPAPSSRRGVHVERSLETFNSTIASTTLRQPSSVAESNQQQQVHQRSMPHRNGHNNRAPDIRGGGNTQLPPVRGASS